MTSVSSSGINNIGTSLTDREPKTGQNDFMIVNPTEEEKALMEQSEITNPKMPYSLNFVSESFTPLEKMDSRIYSKIEEIPTLQITNITPQYVKDNYTYGFVMILGKTWDYKISALKGIGIRLLGLHSMHSYKAKIPLNKINELEQLSFVKWVGYSTNKQKFDTVLNSKIENGADSSEELEIYINLFDDDLSGEFKNILLKEGVEVGDYFPDLRTYYARANLSTIHSISEYDFVLFIEVPGVVIETHDQSTPSISADYIRGGVYNGSGIKVAIIDTGYNSSHQDLPNINVCNDYTAGPTDCTADPNGHGTHVACTLLGRGNADSKYKGVAPGVDYIMMARIMEDNGSISTSNFVKAINWTGDASPAAQIASTSIGVTYAVCRGTDFVSRSADHTIFAHGVILVAAAGNCGPGGNAANCSPISPGSSKTMLAPACSKNTIAVGSVYDYGHGQVDQISDFSSRGPADDCSSGDSSECRRKPDLVAPGEYVTSCDYHNPDGYITKRGTSMAAPHVAGVIAILLDHYPSYIGDTSALKAWLLSSALNKGGDKSNMGNTYGFGKVETYLAYGNRNESDGWFGKVLSGSITDGQEAHSNVSVPPNSKRLTVVLVWHEPADSAGASNSTINDLDLDVDGHVSATGIDNVEYVSIDNPSAGILDIDVEAYHVDPSVSPQAFSVGYMVIRGDPTPVTNLTNKTSNTSIYVNQIFTVTAKVSPSEFVASGVSTNITVPSGVTVLSMNTTREDGVVMNYAGSEQSIEGVDRINLGDIKVGDSREVTWVLKATTTGTKNICVNTNSDNAGINSSCMNVAASNPPPENCSNNIDDDLDSYTDCDDGDCTQGTSCGTNQWCCGAGCSTNGGSCSCAGISGLTCVDGTCNTYNEACCDGELGRNMQCSGISLVCIGGEGSCIYNCGAPQWCDGLVPGGSVCEDSPGIYDELACELLGTDCYYQGENDCNAPPNCDEKDKDDCSGTSGFQCEWQDTYLDNVVEECESTDCGAISQCDEQQPGYDYTSCTTGDKSYFADQCSSSCQGEDRGDNICRSSSFAAGCTADSRCDGVTAGTGDCTLNCEHIANETEGRIAIEQGINNSVIVGQIIYTDYYMRYLNESTDEIGLFDKITENLNQTWAFNYVTAGESVTDMKNLTNVVYVLELANRTSTNITLEVESFINVTKI